MEGLREHLSHIVGKGKQFKNVEVLAKTSRVSATVLRYFMKGVTKGLKFEDAARLGRAIGIRPDDPMFGPISFAAAGETESRSLEDRVADIQELMGRLVPLVEETKRLVVRVQASLDRRAKKHRRA